MVVGPAEAYGEAISVSPTQGLPGSTVAITGTGWRDHGHYDGAGVWQAQRLSIRIEEPYYRQVAFATPAPDGTFRVNGTIPSDITPGTIELSVIIGNGSSARASFRVMPPATTAVTTTPPPTVPAVASTAPATTAPIATTAPVAPATTGPTATTGPSATTAPTPTTTPGERKQVRWLVAGDSFSSGEGTASTEGDCARATSAWGRSAAEAMKTRMSITSIDFVACSGATFSPGKGFAYTGNTWDNQLLGARLTGNAPYSVISFTFGGNDVGFSAKVLDCLGLNGRLLTLAPRPDLRTVLPYIATHRCTFGVDKLLDDIRSKQSSLATLFRSIVDDHSLLAPDGVVLVAGYPMLFEDPSRWPAWMQAIRYCEGIHRDDVVMFREGVKELNRVIREATAVSPRLHYVDVEGTSGRALCSDTPPDKRTLNGVTILPRWQRSFHPTQAGHDYFRDQAVSKLASLSLKW